MGPKKESLTGNTLLNCFRSSVLLPAAREGIAVRSLKPADGWLTAVSAPPLGLPKAEGARPQHGHIKWHQRTAQRGQGRDLHNALRSVKRNQPSRGIEGKRRIPAWPAAYTTLGNSSLLASISSQVNGQKRPPEHLLSSPSWSTATPPSQGTGRRPGPPCFLPLPLTPHTKP